MKTDTCLSAFIAGVAGALFGGLQSSVSDISFAPINNIVLFLFAVVGGITTVSGALVGGALFALLPYVQSEAPELAGLVNLLYPVLPDTQTMGRDDLVAVLLTGVPGLNFTGSVQADLLRLNTAIPPAANPSPLGALAGDFQGFPNGRRLADDVTDIEVRAVACGYGPILAGALGLCNLSPNNTIGDGVDANENTFLSSFPYVAAPNRGYEHTGHR